MFTDANLRKDHKSRLEAFDFLEELKNQKISRSDIITKIHSKFGVPIGTIYDWYNGRLPYGRKSRLKHLPELFYVLGALLGDGCLYKWRLTNHYVILVGDERFATKYADMLSLCVDKKVKAYLDRSKNIWFVRINDFKLYSLFEKIRQEPTRLFHLLKHKDLQDSHLFIEGFFDAEGCVKIIKEKSRRTPKICLDITNTNLKLLDLIKELIEEQLNILARYSIQKEAISRNRKTAYHLRIYKKADIKQFLDHIKTTKLKKEKILYVKNWLNNGK